MKSLITLAALAVYVAQATAAGPHHHHHHSEMHHNHLDTAPAGVMGSHLHGKGDWMFSYRFMHMDMDGNRDGTDSMSTAEVLSEGFMIAPVRMRMDMHMFGAMYAPSDNVTLMMMAPYMDIDMDHVTGMGARFTTRTSGIGDIKFSGLIRLKDWGQQHLHLNAGISAPTGSIDEEDDTPMGTNQPLPYPMQLGSGTWDLLPGITYLGQNDAFSWGAQLSAVIRLGENDNDYTLGDRRALTGWIAKKINNTWSISARLNWQDWDNIDGSDSELSPMAPNMVPTADPNRRAGDRLDLSVGANAYLDTGALKGHRLSIELGYPLRQDLDGPQLETDWTLTAGWQYAM